MSVVQTQNPIVQVASTLLGRGDDGGVPVNRNDLGFNRVDYPLVRSIVGKIDQQGGVASQKQLRGLFMVMKKYHRQIGEIGFEIPQLKAAIAEGAETAPAIVIPTTPTPIPTGIERQFAQPEPESKPSKRPIPRMADILGSSGPIGQRLPGYEPRPSQIELSQDIANAIEADKSILAEGPTGTGKSVAYLVPAIYSGRKTIVSTEGKALQDQLSGTDLPFLKSALPVDFEYAVLKGVGNYVCKWEWTDEASKQAMVGKADEFATIEQWLERTISGDLAESPIQPSHELRPAITISSDDCLGKECPFAGECFYLRAKAKAEMAQIVVVNHTLLTIDLAVRDMTEGGASVLPDRELVIVDEAHALEDVATKAFTDELSEFSIGSLLSGKRAKLAGIERDETDDARHASDDLFNHLKRDERQTFLVTPTENLRVLGSNLINELLPFKQRANYAASDAAKDTDRKALERYADRIGKTVDVIKAVTGLLVAIDDRWIIYAEIEFGRHGNRIARLKRAPVTVADDLKRSLWDQWPVVAASATLTTNGDFDYIRERTGCDRARAVSVDSPFDYKRNALIYLPQDGRSFDPTLYYQDGQPEYYDRLAHETERLLIASDGRAFCLFTSRKAMDEVYRRISYRLSWTVLKQGDYGTRDLVQRFKDDGHAVLFGVRSFWTGVDVQGDALSMVIIDKLPFPTPDDPIFESRKQLLTRQSNDKWAWFNRLSLPIATMQFKQACGRLIRSKTDVGVLALLDGRLSCKPYGKGIVRSLPPAPVVRSIEDVQTFFASR